MVMPLVRRHSCIANTFKMYSTQHCLEPVGVQRIQPRRDNRSWLSSRDAERQPSRIDALTVAVKYRRMMSTNLLADLSGWGRVTRLRADEEVAERRGGLTSGRGWRCISRTCTNSFYLVVHERDEGIGVVDTCVGRSIFISAC